MNVVRLLDGRALAAALHDAVALLVAGYAAAMLTAGDSFPAPMLESLGTLVMIAVPTQLAVNIVFGVYKGIWRYTSLPDVQRVVFAVRPEGHVMGIMM